MRVSDPTLYVELLLIVPALVTYNHPETIYYKAARKLWHFAKEKVFNKIALIEHKRSFAGIGSYELGFSVDEPGIPMEVDEHEPAPLVDASQQTAFVDLTNQLPRLDEIRDSKEDEPLEDGMTADEILEQARQAAQCAADRLTLQRPNGAHLSFLRQRNDGSTSLGIVGAPASSEQEVKLEDLVTRLTEGSSYLCEFKEPESNRVRPIEALETAPFASYLPSFDSTRSNMSKEDSALLTATYGEDELGVQFSSSVMQFATESDYIINMVDSLLDVLTHGQHSKAAQKVKEDQAQAKLANENKTDGDDEVAESMSEEATKIQSELDDASDMVFELADIQHKRLSSTTKPIKPAEEEVTLATKLTQKLAEMIGVYTAPVDITDIKSVRKAMGIEIN